MKIEPPAQAWPDMLAAFVRGRTDDQRTRAGALRAQTGLPTDALVVMTGHQPGFWHAGVLVKFFAAQAFAERVSARVGWVVPDMDEADPAALRVPVIDGAGRLRVESLPLAPAPPTGAAIASARAFDPVGEAPTGAAPASVCRGVAAAIDALRAHRHEASAARQAQAAVADAIRPFVAPAPTVFASSLHATELFDDLLSRMLDDPRAMAGAYNQAAGEIPEAGVTSLIANEARGRFELPLWRIRPGEPRRRVYAHEAAGIERGELAPRALLMTAMMRMAGCDLFIHGTGGAVYDRVTALWIQSWLGETLAPSVSVTATLTLALRDETPDPREARDAAWRAHRARHDPALLGDDAEARRKRELVEAIRAKKARGADPADEFRALHALLASWRAGRSADLEALRDRARSLRERVEERDIVLDRTWPFLWHEAAALRGLQGEVAEAFGVGSRVSAPG